MLFSQIYCGVPAAALLPLMDNRDSLNQYCCDGAETGIGINLSRKRFNGRIE